MGITTDKIMDALATQISCKIIRRNHEIYTFQGKKLYCVGMPLPQFKISFDEKTGIVTSEILQEQMQQSFERIAAEMWKEYLGSHFK
jgi:hypothetical protein